MVIKIITHGYYKADNNNKTSTDALPPTEIKKWKPSHRDVVKTSVMAKKV